jgi:hypothetical protein
MPACFRKRSRLYRGPRMQRIAAHRKSRLHANFFDLHAGPKLGPCDSPSPIFDIQPQAAEKNQSNPRFFCSAIQLGNTHQGITKRNESDLAPSCKKFAGEGFECDQKEYGCNAKTVQNEGRCELSRNVHMGDPARSEQG